MLAPLNCKWESSHLTYLYLLFVDLKCTQNLTSVFFLIIYSLNQSKRTNWQSKLVLLPDRIFIFLKLRQKKCNSPYVYVQIIVQIALVNLSYWLLDYWF